jgi:hypothetical protein
MKASQQDYRIAGHDVIEEVGKSPHHGPAHTPVHLWIELRSFQDPAHQPVYGNAELIPKAEPLFLIPPLRLDQVLLRKRPDDET